MLAVLIAEHLLDVPIRTLQADIAFELRSIKHRKPRCPAAFANIREGCGARGPAYRKLQFLALDQRLFSRLISESPRTAPLLASRYVT